MSPPSDGPTPPTAAAPLIRPPGHGGAPPSRRRLLSLLVAAVVALIGGAIAWRVFGGVDDPAAEPGGTRLAAVELAAPIGGPEARDGSWARLRVAPARPGTNAVSLRATDADGRPLPAGEAPPLVLAIASLDDPTEAPWPNMTLDDAGSSVGEAELGGGWWRADVRVGDPEAPAVILPFYFLLPDPNLHGTDAVAVSDADDAARAVLERGLTGLTGLHRVRYREALGDGQGHLALSDWAVDDGAAGGPPAYSYRAPGGAESVVVGDRRWLRRPGEGWETGPGAPPVPPAEWGADYAGAIGARLGGEETVDGERCQIVTFAVPERTEPRRLAAAWYAWWVGVESGRLRREAMVSRNHYMVRAYADFDVPLAIAPPADAPDPATPTASPSAASR